MIAKSAIDALAGLIEEKHMLKHPFYQLWTRGALTIASLQGYAKQYYHHVAAFPTYVSAVHSNCPYIEVRQALLENLVEEEQGEENHAELWIGFGEGLGVQRDQMTSTPPLPETKALVQTFTRLTREGSFLEGLAVLHAYESQIPKVSQVKIDGLRKFYGITDSRSLRFFTAHMKYDVIHSKVEEQFLKKHVKDSQSAKKVYSATNEALDALGLMLDGVMGEFVDCPSCL